MRALKIAKLYSSPYIRCVSTIQPFVRASGISIEHMDDLRERKVVEGIVEDFDEIWERSWEDFGFTMPNCESSSDAQARICKAISRICGIPSKDPIGVSSHGNVIGLLLNSLDPSFGAQEAKMLRNPDVLLLCYDKNGLSWDRSFQPPPSLSEIATPFSDMPLPMMVRVSNRKGKGENQ